MSTTGSPFGGVVGHVAERPAEAGSRADAAGERASDCLLDDDRAPLVIGVSLIVVTTVLTLVELAAPLM